jgi:hypothetical protein
METGASRGRVDAACSRWREMEKDGGGGGMVVPLLQRNVGSIRWRLLPDPVPFLSCWAGLQLRWAACGVVRG